MDTIRELEKQGYRFELSDGYIRFKYLGQGNPDPAIVKPLLAELKARKAETIKYIQARRQGQVVDFESEARKIRTVLKKRGIVKLHSRTLGEDVYWARDDREATKVLKGAVVYTLDELRHLVDIKADPEALHQIHQTKKIFGGKLMGEVQDPFAPGDGGADPSPSL